jgi:hypothetical protein
MEREYKIEWGDGKWNGFEAVDTFSADLQISLGAPHVNPVQVVQLSFHVDLETRNGKRM